MPGVARSFFSVELCFSLTNSFGLHREAQRVLGRTPDTVSPAAKWANHRQIADLMLSTIADARRGCWEYMDDDGDDAMWDDWLLPLKDRSRQPKGEDEGPLFTITLMIQAKRFAQTDRILKGAFDDAGDNLWTKGTFAAMLQAIPAISFGSVVKDALYLMPRDTSKGFTDAELNSERMKYLRVLG
jgi:hypothetical protein